MASATYNCTADNTLVESTPTLNFGNSTGLTLGESVAQHFVCPMNFDFSALPTGAVMSAVTFNGYCSAVTTIGGDRAATVDQIVRTDWSEGAGNSNQDSNWTLYKTGSTWSTAGCLNTTTDIDITNRISWTMPSASGAFTITGLLAMANSAALTYAKILRIRLGTNAGTGENMIISSRENATTANRPTITITYTVPLLGSTGMMTGGMLDMTGGMRG